MLPKHHRLRRSSDFSSVLRARRSSGARRSGTSRIMVHRGPVVGASGPARVGFTVSSAVGNSVVRHRVTRRLRALMADRIERCPAGSDLVIRATPRAAQGTWTQLGEDLDRSLDRVLR